MKNAYFFFLIILFLSAKAYSQNVLDDIEEEDKVEIVSTEKEPSLATETIKSISRSKKIFIITNDNQSFYKGDFISLVLNKKLVCRAIVAKISEQQLSGIKVVKIYDNKLWEELKESKSVQIIRGDDSFFSIKGKSEKVADSKIKSDEDLYNNTSIVTAGDDDLGLEETSKRIIRTDNLLSINYGLIDGKDINKADTKYPQLNGSWAYQASDNIWIEGILGSNVIKDYPDLGLDTRMINAEVRAKYTFTLPFYSYAQTYVGYQSITAESPGAETTNDVSLINNLKKQNMVFGVTLLKRVVPGWFIRADLGTDIINTGLTLEF